ncbi:TPA: recombinase family protein [Stenotrophomonas maltophilia]|nr:recombinase family protein [Stenotrophomonas maltophilia]HDS1295727.1 recombinase family protein [Stenotrophomonas maltophilia]
MPRSVLDLAKTTERLKKRGISLPVLDKAVDETTSGRLVFNLLGVFEGFEADMLDERQRE